MTWIKAALAAAGFGIAAWAGPAAAQTSEAADSGETIVVEAPGPELWRLHDADSEVFILATINALPRGFRWNSRPVAAVLDRADRLYVSEPVSIGFGDAARLLVTRRDALRNPDDARLEDYLPASLHRRLAAAAALQDVDMEDLEDWRAYVAGGRLLGGAVEDAGLETDGQVLRETRRLARRARVRIQEVDMISAGALIDALNEMPVGRDAPCLAMQLDALDRQLPALRARADAWARGDVAALREFSTLVDASACLSSLGGAGLSASDVEARALATWRATLIQGLSGPACGWLW